MKQFVIVLYLFVIFTLGAATITERIYGTSFTEKEVYGTAWFFTLWLLLGLTGIYMLIKMKIWRKASAALLHFSFIAILSGAAITFFNGTKGYMHLEKGEETNCFTDMGTNMQRELPFSLRLDSFAVKYYNGTDVPSDYVSYITVNGKQHIISMNNILKLQGYRFYQSSYDENNKGSWLSVSHDPYGNAITYSGYLLLFLSVCFSLFSPNGTFRKLLRHPLLKKGMTFAIAIMLGTINMQAGKTNVLNKETADSIARCQVLYKGRITPFDTQARDFLKKLSGSDTYKGLSAVQVVTSWQLSPEEWYKQPVIKIKDKALRHKLGVTSEHISLSQLYDEKHEYRLQKILNEEREKNTQSTITKAIFETDEKAGMILMLCNGTLIKELPQDGSIRPLSDTAVEAEIIYNSIPFTKILFIVNLTLGFFAFFVFLFITAKGYGKMSRTILKFLRLLLYTSTCTIISDYAMRWYIGGRIPLSNGYETMLFMALSIMLVSCLMERRFPFVLIGGFILSGFTLLVAHLGEMNPQITPLMPVLTSPLLSIHVSLIMISYALFAFIMLNGILTLALMKRKDKNTGERVKTITILSRLMLYPAVLFLGAGIFIGAIWANISWGRYWAWDPKEVWALITFMIYGAAFHTKSIEKFKNGYFFHIYMIIAFVAVLITYFGVNYLLGGMHSYANA